MKHRGYLEVDERQARSRLAKIVHQQPFLQGSLIDSTFKCGKKNNCWCAKAKEGHPACYLSIRVGKKRKMIYIPKDCEKQIREWVKTYREINRSIAKVSKCCLDRFRKRKE